MPSIASYIDHTVLKPEATKDHVIQACNEAKQYHFASVCINPCFTKLVAECLQGTDILICPTIGFPLGANTSASKAFEAKDAILNGATEMDMGINVGAVKSKDLDYVERDILAVLKETQGKVKLKVILETCLLSAEEIISVCQIAQKIGVDFVKTSTGFNSAGATIEHVALMRRTVGSQMGVKASGGIRSYQFAMDLINAGATRIGASASVKIMHEEAELQAKTKK